MSVCLSCGHQRDSCEICGGDLEDAHVYCAALTQELALLRDVKEAGEAYRDEVLDPENELGYMSGPSALLFWDIDKALAAYAKWEGREQKVLDGREWREGTDG